MLGNQRENKVGTNCGISTRLIMDHSKTGAMGTRRFSPSMIPVTEATRAENLILCAIWNINNNKK